MNGFGTRARRQAALPVSGSRFPWAVAALAVVLVARTAYVGFADPSLRRELEGLHLVEPVPADGAGGLLTLQTAPTLLLPSPSPLDRLIVVGADMVFLAIGLALLVAAWLWVRSTADRGAFDSRSLACSSRLAGGLVVAAFLLPAVRMGSDAVLAARNGLSATVSPSLSVDATLFTAGVLLMLLFGIQWRGHALADELDGVI